MRVILKENIENLGKKGDIVNVASGFGRNYLIPKKLALKVTPSNMKMIEMEQQALRKRFDKEASSYQDLTERLNQMSLSFERKAGEKDVIFGSVSSSDIKEALDKLGYEVEKKKILLDEPIKRLGNYTVPIKVYHEEQAEIKVEIVKEGAEGKEIKEEAVDIVSEAEKEAPAEEEEGVSEEKVEVPEVEEQEKLEKKKETAIEDEAKDVDETKKEEVTAGEKQEEIEEKEEQTGPIDKEDLVLGEEGKTEPIEEAKDLDEKEGKEDSAAEKKEKKTSPDEKKEKGAKDEGD